MTLATSLPHTLSRARHVDRLRRRADFAAVLRSGRRARRGPLAIAVCPNDWGRTRVGYAVGRRVGGAVVRNRVRRRLRALIDELLTLPGPSILATRSPSTDLQGEHRSQIAPADTLPLDIVITAFADAATAPFATLRRDLASALRGAGVECAPAATHEPAS